MLVIQWECHLPQQMDRLQTALEVQTAIHQQLEQEPVNQKPKSKFECRRNYTLNH